MPFGAISDFFFINGDVDTFSKPIHSISQFNFLTLREIILYPISNEKAFIKIPKY